MNHRILMSATAILTTATLLVACSGGSAKDPASNTSAAAPAGAAAPYFDMLPPDVQKRGELVVATDASYPPFEFFDTDNKTIIGADPELAAALAQKLGVKLKLQNGDFAGIVPGIAAGKYDIAMSGLADTAERRKQVSFVDYALSGVTFIVPSKDSDAVHGWSDVCGMTASVQTGTTMVGDIEEANKKYCASEPITIGSYHAQDEAVLAVNSGRADVLVTTGGSGAYIEQQANDTFTMIVPNDPVRKGSSLGIALSKDQPKLAKALQAALAEVVKDGTYAKIWDKSGLSDCCSNTSGTINDGKGL